MKSLGPVYTLDSALFHGKQLVCADHTAAQYIFQHSDKYVKAPVYRPIIEKLVGRGLLWAEGAEHKRQRRILSPAFSTESIRGMENGVWACTERMEERLLKAAPGTFNIVPYTSACTLDIIGRVAFGHDFGSGQSAEAKAIAAAWNKDVQLGLTTTGALAPMIIQSFPWITRLPIPGLLEEGVTKSITRDLAAKILQKGDIDEKGKDILSLLVKGAGEHMADEQLLDNISTFIMAGHETTTATLNFTLMRLARDKLIQRKLREELLALGPNFNAASVQKVEYLDAVIREGLRLHSAVPRTDRLALEDDVIPLSKPVKTLDGRTLTSLHIKVGQVIHVPFLTMQLREEVWGPHPEEFRPERWSDGSLPPASELPHGPWGNIISFLDGPRSCIGYRLALLELKIMTAMIIRSFELHDTGVEIQQVWSPSLQPVVEGKGGVLPLRVIAVPH
ncbi:cytochrome P450 [Stereum hirsutum FP-91666 SS1]|uniref:cytochrome P450 n=1 Tax=Stereum hirsutum (strain FP-91666) TaxID=721885 RepID=UPI000444954D|nr:cytochrome P450 [Stereum hirsutum FP-91666 SS1]EIM83576.1 cytochrome P450 [Stereum hirsutum FP-91666 SS1]